MIKRWLMTILIFFLSALLVDAAVISIIPPNQTVNLGDPVEVQLEVSGLGALAAPSLATFDITVSFDTSILTFGGATYGDPIRGDQLDLFGFGSITATALGASSVSIFQLSFDLASDLDALQLGSFAIASLMFDTNAVGTSSLSVVNPVLGDSLGNPLSIMGVNNAEIHVERASQPMPEPNSALLLLAGLAAARCRWRKSAGRPSCGQPSIRPHRLLARGEVGTP